MIFFLGLGSNLGNRDNYLLQAKNYLGKHPQIEILRSSKIIQTKPYGKLDQPDFKNMVIEVESSLSTFELLDFCLETEAKLDRVRLEKWGPRTIDIDILLGEEIINEENLKVPHPELHKREFVLSSLVTLCPERIHPILNKTIKQLHEELEKRTQTENNK